MGGLLSPGSLTPGDAVDAARNVLLLAGWGLVEVVTDAGRTRRRRVIGAVAGGALIGVAAEVVQLAIPPRSPSLLDAAMNTAGAGLGAFLADLARRGLRHRRSAPLGVPTLALAAPYLLAVFLEAGFPLLRHADAGLGWGGPLRRVSWAVENFSWRSAAVLPALDFLLFLPAGFLLAAALRERGRTGGRVLGWSVACGAAVSVAGELLHAPLGRPVEVGPVLVHTAAFGAGAALALVALPRWLRDRSRADRLRGFLWAYVAVLALWRLRPFAPELDPGAIADELALRRWSPLSALGVRQDLYSVSDVLRSFLLFVPVGVALAARERPATRGGGHRLSALGWVLALAAALEVGQALVAGRFFDGTDLLVMAAGGATAWSLARDRASPR